MPEYKALTTEQKAELVKEFENHKASRACGLRISTKSRVNDVTKTLKVIENEVQTFSCSVFMISPLSQLSNLRSRTGVESLLFTTRGSTDLPLRGIVYETDGIENFLEGAMKMDTQHFIGKMEGFAVQGVKGWFYFGLCCL